MDRLGTFEVREYMKARSSQFRAFMAAAMASGDCPYKEYQHNFRANWCWLEADALMRNLDEEKEKEDAEEKGKPDG